MAAARPDLTLLIPCFNEGRRIDACLGAARTWIATYDGDVEILCVDDGSTDDTSERLAEAGVRTVTLERNSGKGAALRTGMAAAAGALVVFFDADLAVDLTHLDPALAALTDGADVVIGCRNVPGAAIRRPQGFVRRLLGRCYLRGTRFVLGLRASDVTCGFKGFRREAGQRLFGQARARGWGIDAEILMLAERGGLEVAQIPVQWFDGDTSAVRMHRDVFKTLGELFALRCRHLFRRTARADSPVAAGTVRDA